MKSILFTAILSLLSFGAYSSTSPSYPPEGSVTEIKMSSLKAVEANGKVYFVSDNNRFFFDGKVMDLWNKKPLNTIEEIKYAASHINMDQLIPKDQQINEIVIGKGTQDVYAFVGPECSYCKIFAEKAANNSTYRTHLIVIPSSGKKADVMAKALFCSKSKKNALKHYLNQTLTEMVQLDNCDLSGYNATLIMSEVMVGVRAVPYFVAPDGRHGNTDYRKVFEWFKKL